MMAEDVVGEMMEREWARLDEMTRRFSLYRRGTKEDARIGF
jgi:hypothetical protein